VVNGFVLLTHHRLWAKFHIAINLKLYDNQIKAAVKLGVFRSKQKAVSTALARSAQRRRRLRILELGGKIEFDPKWDHKKMRQGRP
jgi:hypothetical protein